MFRTHCYGYEKNSSGSLLVLPSNALKEGMLWVEGARGGGTGRQPDSTWRKYHNIYCCSAFGTHKDQVELESPAKLFPVENQKVGIFLSTTSLLALRNSKQTWVSIQETRCIGINHSRHLIAREGASERALFVLRSVATDRGREKFHWFCNTRVYSWFWGGLYWRWLLVKFWS